MKSYNIQYISFTHTLLHAATMLWRYIFLYFCSVIAFVVCGLIINITQLLLYFTIGQLSAYLYKKINYYLCYSYFCLYVFIVDWYADCELNLYMNKNDFNKYFGKEHSYLICNHSYEIDWILLLSLADKGHLLGNSKTFAKNDVQFVPGLGLLLHFADYIFLARKFEKDKKTIENKMLEIMKYPDPAWIVLYPEGTRFTKLKHENSMRFARQNGLPSLKYHLSPRTKGFTTSLPALNGKLKAVYDVTLAFKPSDENKPKIFNLLFGRKIKAYFYIKRIPFEDIPKDEKGASQFIHDLFVQKDKLRDSFDKYEDFFTEIKVKGVEKITMSKNFLVLLNALFWYLLSVGIVLYYLIQLILVGKTLVFIFCVIIIFLITYVMNKFVSMSKLDNVSAYGLYEKK